MRYSREDIEANLNSIDRQLMLMVYDQLCENNRLLAILANEKEQVTQMPDEHKTTPKTRGRKPKTA